MSTTEGCRRCVDGKYGDGRGLLSCKSCPAGKYDHTVGGGARYGEGFDSLNVCRNCEPNTYSRRLCRASACYVHPTQSLMQAWQAKQTANVPRDTPGLMGARVLLVRWASTRVTAGLPSAKTAQRARTMTKKQLMGVITERCPANSNSTQGSINITNCSCMVGYTGPDGQACENCEAGKFKKRYRVQSLHELQRGYEGQYSANRVRCLCPGQIFRPSRTNVHTVPRKGTFANCTACRSARHATRVNLWT